MTVECRLAMQEIRKWERGDDDDYYADDDDYDDDVFFFTWALLVNITYVRTSKRKPTGRYRLPYGVETVLTLL